MNLRFKILKNTTINLIVSTLDKSSLPQMKIFPLNFPVNNSYHVCLFSDESLGVPERIKQQQEPEETKFIYKLPTEDFEALDTLDIFAGCGGLTEGLDSSKAFRSKWAIEFDPTAAAAFSQNFPGNFVYFVLHLQIRLC